MENKTSSEEKKSLPPHHLHPKTVLALAITAGVCALLLIGFISGRAFERTRVEHVLGWHNNYQEIFLRNNNRHERRPMFGRPPMIDAHTIFGKILSINDNKLVVQDQNQTEQSVLITKQTIIRSQTDNTAGQISDLKTDKQIAIFGRPDGQGQIIALLIRIF